MLCRIYYQVDPLKGISPDAIWYIKQPNEKISLLEENLNNLEESASGAIYSSYGLISLSSFNSEFVYWANNKSDTFKWQNSSNKKFEGLKSPRKILFLWRWRRAAII